MSNLDPHHQMPLSMFGPPAHDAALAVILVHGRGQSPEWMHEQVVRRFARPDIAWHAPAAAESSWYPQRFIEPIEANEPRLSQALARLDSLSAALREQGIPYEAQVLMGFSQGACLCSEFVWRTRRPYRALVAFTGGLIGPPGMSRHVEPGALRNMPVLLSTWDDDPYVPAESVRQSAACFEQAGALVTLKIESATEHCIRNEEIGYAQEILAGAAPSHR